MSQSKQGFLKFLPMFIICQKKGISYIINLHGNLLPKTFKTSGNFIKKIVLNILDKSNGIIVLSELLQQQQIFQMLSSTIYTVKNFVQPEYFVSFEEKKKY